MYNLFWRIFNLLSVFLMYSKDRSVPLSHTINCLRDMPLYSSSQKTLVVDGKIDKIPYDWEAIQVPRIKNKFCWAKMWDAGVFSSRFEKIVYLDSDRMLPTNYLELVNNSLKDDCFIFTSMHFNMLKEVDIDLCKSILQNKTFEEFISDEKTMGLVRYEERFIEPYHGPAKNVMSGSTAFTKKTYFKLGGVDHWYCGHGAYADSDFHMQASSNGCEFIDLKIPELHYIHNKVENKTVLKDKELWKLSLDNFIYYCDKWKLPFILAESLALRCGIDRPSLYINNFLKKLR